jgi:hypothetical protein
MGNEESSMTNHNYDIYGYRVLTVLPGSPAELAGIDS